MWVVHHRRWKPFPTRIRTRIASGSDTGLIFRRELSKPGVTQTSGFFVGLNRSHDRQNAGILEETSQGLANVTAGKVLVRGLSPGGTHRRAAGGGERNGWLRVLQRRSAGKDCGRRWEERDRIGESFRVWDNLVVHRLREPESAGSNPAILTAR